MCNFPVGAVSGVCSMLELNGSVSIKTLDCQRLERMCFTHLPRIISAFSLRTTACCVGSGEATVVCCWNACKVWMSMRFAFMAAFESGCLIGGFGCASPIGYSFGMACSLRIEFPQIGSKSPLSTGRCTKLPSRADLHYPPVAQDTACLPMQTAPQHA